MTRLGWFIFLFLLSVFFNLTFASSFDIISDLSRIAFKLSSMEQSTYLTVNLAKTP